MKRRRACTCDQEKESRNRIVVDGKQEQNSKRIRAGAGAGDKRISSRRVRRKDGEHNIKRVRAVSKKGGSGYEENRSRRDRK